jgi:hypothetical protein
VIVLSSTNMMVLGIYIWMGGDVVKIKIVVFC